MLSLWCHVDHVVSIIVYVLYLWLPFNGNLTLFFFSFVSINQHGHCIFQVILLAPHALSFLPDECCSWVRKCTTKPKGLLCIMCSRLLDIRSQQYLVNNPTMGFCPFVLQTLLFVREINSNNVTRLCDQLKQTQKRFFNF